MTTAIKRRRGTTADHSTFTGLEGEITVDTTKDTLVVHDGSTAGGFPLAKENNATLTGAVTFSAGTANGVAYFNGSKVLTSGSALTFDGTNLGLGGATNPGAYSRYLEVAGADAAVYVRDTNIAGGWGALTQSGSSSYLINNQGDWRFWASGSERMRLTSTGLGIGTTAPPADALLTLAGAQGTTQSLFFNGFGTDLDAAISHSNGSLIFSGGGNNTTVAALTERMRLTSTGLGIGTSSPNRKLDVRGTDTWIKVAENGVASWLIGTGTTSALRFFDESSVERMRLDSSGNLGLGVTPSAWVANNYVAMQAGRSGSFSARASVNQVNLSDNAAVLAGTGWTYLTTAAASTYQQGSGAHLWFTAPSGTAGNAISFTQAMTLDASGILLVGKTATGVGTVGFAAKDFIEVTRDGNPSAYFTRLNSDGDLVQFRRSSGSAVGSISVTTTATAYNTSSDYRLKDITGPITTSGAYIDSLNPVEGTWKADGSTFVGLIAHEVQEASRTTVATGVKDGEEMQGMDYSSSEIIANLIAEVKSLRQRLAALEAA